MKLVATLLDRLKLTNAAGAVVNPATDESVQAVTARLVAGIPVTGNVTVVDSVPLAVSGTVTVANPTANPETGLAKDATLNARWKALTGGPTLVAVTTPDQVIYTPAAGKRARLKWMYAATPDDGLANVIVTVKIGATALYTFPLGAPGIFAHGSIREGAIDAPITVTLSAARPVYFNVDCEDF